MGREIFILAPELFVRQGEGGEGKTDREGQFSPGSTASFVRSNWPRDKDASKLKNPSVKRVDSSGWVALAISLACDRRSRDHTTA